MTKKQEVQTDKRVSKELPQNNSDFTAFTAAMRNSNSATRLPLSLAMRPSISCKSLDSTPVYFGKLLNAFTVGMWEGHLKGDILQLGTQRHETILS
eukprot:3934416-Amphidinium_carterae.1